MGIRKASKNGIFYDLVLNKGGGSGSPKFFVFFGNHFFVPKTSKNAMKKVKGPLSASLNERCEICNIKCFCKNFAAFIKVDSFLAALVPQLYTYLCN